MGGNAENVARATIRREAVLVIRYIWNGDSANYKHDVVVRQPWATAMSESMRLLDVAHK